MNQQQIIGWRRTRNLSAEGLNNFDASEVHKKWKDAYGDRLESKAIFDCD